jgi:hypothetical protein
MTAEGIKTGYSREFVALSIAGAMVIMALAALSYPGRNAGVGAVPIESRIVAAIAFALSCAFGIVLCVNPGLAGRLVHRFHTKDVHFSTHVKKKKTKISGHHPYCRAFSWHTIVIGNRTFCAGCTGTIIGLAISIMLTIVFSIHPVSLPSTASLIQITSGYVIVAVCLAEASVRKKIARVHALLSALLPVGFFLVFFGLLGYSGSLISAAIALLVCFLWMDTRIQLSKRNHDRICAGCRKKCTFPDASRGIRLSSAS